MRGRKPSNPKVKDLEAGRLRVVGGGADASPADDASPPSKGPGGSAKQIAPPPPWLKNRHAKDMWRQVLPKLIQRHQYLDIFSAELARYCFAYGQFVDAANTMQRAPSKGGGPVIKSSKGTPMLSMHYVVAKGAHETMRQLAGDLGLNPVAQLRMQGLQLDLFDQPTPEGTPANRFAAYRA